MDVVQTIQTVKNLEVEIRKNEGDEIYNNISWENPAIQNSEPQTEACTQDYSDDDDEPILPLAPRSASTPEPAPAPLFSDDDDMDLFDDPPSPTPAQKELARLNEIRDIYNGPCPPSPIAPTIQTSEQDYIDQWAWEERQQYTDEQNLLDNNTNWLYVPSLPLCINVTLMDPTLVDRPNGSDPICSSISQCTCTDEIVSAKCDLSSKCESNGTKGLTKWMMDSGASMAFTSDPQDYSELIYLSKDKQIPVSTANGIASIIGFGTVFLRTEPSGTPTIVRIHPVFLLPGLKE